MTLSDQRQGCNRAFPAGPDPLFACPEIDIYRIAAMKQGCLSSTSIFALSFCTKDSRPVLVMEKKQNKTLECCVHNQAA